VNKVIIDKYIVLTPEPGEAVHSTRPLSKEDVKEMRRVHKAAKKARVCKSRHDWRDYHTPVNEPHPSIKSVTRTVCSECGTVIDWISIEERTKRTAARAEARGGRSGKGRSKRAV
jgi:hypothetical protein